MTSRLTLSGLIALAFLETGTPRHATRPGDSIRSHRLTVEALDQEALLNLDSALTLYRAARLADSSDVVAEYYYVRLRDNRYEYGALRDEYAANELVWRPRGAFCWTPAVVALAQLRLTVTKVMYVERTGGATPCTVALLSEMAMSPPVSKAARREYTARATREFPDLFETWSNFAQMWEDAGQSARAEAVWVEADRAVSLPLLRVRLEMSHVDMLLARGDTTRARAMQRAIRSTVLRDGRRGMIAEYLGRLEFIPALWDADGGEEHIVSQLVRLFADAGDWSGRVHALSAQAKKLADRGELVKAISYASQAIAIADSVRVSDLQLEVHTLRGRAFTKAGRYSDAERDLMEARAAGEHAARLYYRADAYHNLAHLYESEGRWSEATSAVDHFVALAGSIPSSLQVTSLLDAAAIRWKAGWHASAELTYQKMVRAIDRARVEWYLAGEYFERRGDLSRARHYYSLGLQHAGTEPMSLAGMSRVQEALGHADSAEKWARAHDARIVSWPPLEVPLLPAVLARHGRLAEAGQIAHRWADRQLNAGNVEGAAISRLQVAELELDAGRPESALAEAIATERLATGSQLTREVIRAHVIRGRALLRFGRPRDGLNALEEALEVAKRHPSVDLLLQTHLALGEARARAGDAKGALIDYEAAAHAVERSTSALPTDLDRAGYRDRHIAPFDGAIRVILDHLENSSRDSDLLRWSARRTAAALALAANGSSEGLVGDARTPDLPTIQQRLDPDEAFLNFIVIDSDVFAVGVSRNVARTARLPILADSLRTLINSLRNPLISTSSGRIDLARARYSLGIAAELYRALIRPFEDELAGKKRLLIAADGPLHALAFDALVAALPPGGGESTDYQAAVYLLDKVEVEYVPSPAFVPASGDRANRRDYRNARLLAVGYGAPASDSEIQAIRESWPRARLKTLEGIEATESTVRARMSGFDVLHFAVHASANARDPLASHLRLAEDSLNDGYLHATEIDKTRINAGLVVLSACETNAGPIYNGEGVIGIARAFVAAGAREVVGTQWPLGGEAAGLMREFYARLSRGATPSAALRAAKLTFRRSPEFAHPFHWAGFMLIR